MRRCLVLLLLLCCQLLAAPLAGGPAGPRAMAAPQQSSLKVFNFRETPLAEVLMLFTEATKKNVVATPTIMDTPITLYLENVTPMVALSVLCKNYNFWFNEEDGVIRVMKLDEYGRELMLRRDERTEFFPLRYASCLGVADAIQNVFVDIVEYNEPEDMTSYRHVGTDKLPSIGQGIDEADSGSGSSSSSSSSSRNNRNRNTQQSQRRQVSKDVLEAGALEMGTQDLGKLRQIVETGGQVTAQELLEFQVGRTKAQLTVFARSNAILVRSVDTRLLADIAALIKKLDTPTPQVLLECKILEVNLSDGFESFFDFSWTPEGVLDTTTGLVTSALPGAVASALGGTGLDESSLRFSYISNTIQAKLEMMQKEGRLRSISTPLVYAANNAAAKFFQGDTVPVRTGYTVSDPTYDSDGRQISPAQVSTEYSLEDLGVLLEVSPSINQDKTVTMKIVADIGMLNQGAGPPFNYNVNGIAQVGETDSVTTTRIEDIILAKEGQSLAIGGLIKEKASVSNNKVPLLGDIPLLGFFFNTKDAVHQRSEIIFVLTAHIINHPEEAGPYNSRLMPTLSDHPWYTTGSNRVLQYNATYDEVYDLDGKPVQEFLHGKSFKRTVREVLIGG